MTAALNAEWSYGWQPAAAQRLRFLIDFSYSTGLRAGEFARAKLGAIEVDAHGDQWLHVVGKFGKAGKVVLPGMARGILDRSLVQRGLPLTPARWDPATPLVGSLEGEAGITAKRLWVVLKKFFATVGDGLSDANPFLVEKLKRATPHWMRHTHATHALQRVRRAHGRAGQPAACVALDDFDVPALRRHSSSQTDRMRVRGDYAVKLGGRTQRVNLHRKHAAFERGALASACRLVATGVFRAHRVSSLEHLTRPQDGPANALHATPLGERCLG